MGVGGAPTTRGGSRCSNGARCRRRPTPSTSTGAAGRPQQARRAFLGDRYGEALEKGDLKLAFDPEEGALSVWHFEHRFPVNPLSYPIVLDRTLAALAEVGDEASAEVLSISERLRRMADEANVERQAGYPEEARG